MGRRGVGRRRRTAGASFAAAAASLNQLEEVVEFDAVRARLDDEFTQRLRVKVIVIVLDACERRGVVRGVGVDAVREEKVSNERRSRHEKKSFGRWREKCSESICLFVFLLLHLSLSLCSRALFSSVDTSPETSEKMDQPSLRAAPPQAGQESALDSLLRTFASTATNFEVPPALAAAVSSHGATLAGALFAAGWSAQADAAVTAPGRLPFVRYLPGILSTVAMVLMATVRRSDIDAYAQSGDDDGVVCRARGALFLAYCLSFAALALAASGLLLSGGGWVGAAGVLNCLFVLAAGLVTFVAGGSSDGDGADFGYGGL